MHVSEQTKSNRAAEIFATLKQRILQWEYPPGYRFTEEEIGKEFGVSRSPVRETLRMLEENNLVDKVPYRGCTVKQPDWQEINELYDVRLVLEVAVIGRIVQRGMSPELDAQLTATWRRLAETTSYTEVDGAELARFDRLFHEALAQSCGNRTLADMLVTVNDRLHFIRMTDITTVERLWETCRQHLAILEFLRSGQQEAAEAAMRTNIEGARAQVEQAIKDVLARVYMNQNQR